jgi:hypothetical protein
MNCRKHHDFQALLQTLAGTLAFVGVAACSPCAGKQGAELDQCEAEETASENNPSCETWDTSARLTDSGTLVTDSSACYRFVPTEDGTVTFALSDYQGKIPGLTLLEDKNGNGEFEADEKVTDNYPSNPNVASVSAPLPKEQVFQLRVDRAATNFNLTGTFERHPDPSPARDPGDEPGEAFDLEALSTARWGGYVGPLDPQDYFAFTLEEVGHVTFGVSDYAGKIPGLSLIRDDNGDGLFQRSELLADNYPSNPNIPALQLALEKGHYFVLVDHADSTYTLVSTYQRFSTVSPAQDPGDKPNDTAFDLGLLSPSAETLGGYIGKADLEDCYVFTVNQPGTASFTVSDYDAKIPGLTLFKDSNNDGLFQPTEKVADNYPSNPTRFNLVWQVPEAGRYFLQVNNADTTYVLSAVFE